MSKKIQLSLVLVAFLSSLHAQDIKNQYTLEDITVTASQGTAIKKKDVTDSVIIITKEAIKEARVSTLAQALNKLGNISMSQNGGMGKSTSMYVRGMETKRLLVLIDGVRYNNPTNIGAAAEFSQIMLYNVDQIEIIKGSQSGVWGSDASGGVINIITSKASVGLHSNIDVEYGSYDSKKGSMQLSYATKKYDILLGGLIYDSDGYSAVEAIKQSSDYGKRYDELGFEKDSYKNKTLNLKLGYNIQKDDRVEVNVQTIDSNVKFDSSSYDMASNSYIPTDSTQPNTDLINRFYHIAYKHKDSLNDLILNYSLSTFKRDILTSYGSSSYKGSVNEVKINDKINYLENSFFRVGLSYQKFEQEEITQDTTKSYSATSAFITNYNKLTLLPNLNTIVSESFRYDKYDEFDNSFTEKIGIKQFIKDDIYFSINGGTGFNAPTLSQLYGQYGANPNLKPETSLTSDITIGNDTVWLSGFYNEIDDLIEYDYTSGYVQVVGKSKFKGIEIGYEDYFLDSFGVSALYTYVKTQNANGEELARRPKNQIDARMTYYASQMLDLGVNAQYIGSRYNDVDKEGAQTGKYTVVNLITNVKVDSKLTFYAKLDNITDKYYQSVDGYATAGRSIYIGLNASY